ncbi:anaerobic ribonucleoside-triphosphate reductase activating protein [Thioalkalicoccus limnaeus]|uniref:Anaerobic ribonucleoside-triphosphate reductase activating protein n=1 Tax=Thioalkalicoccus limnaeus TaxID=120681 RepID=A0ABV4BET4_9GAMM
MTVLARAAAPVDSVACPRPPARHDAWQVAGLTPLTTIDFPGELAAVLFGPGCPWRCRYCHNGHLAADSDGPRIEWSEIRSFLESRRGLLDAVVFSGGEPTAQSGLAVAMAEVKGLGFKVGLHTAGPYPERLPALLPWLDWVGLDIKALPEDYPAITGVPGSGEPAWRSLHLFLEAGTPMQVRTTMMPAWRADDLKPLVDRLADAGVTHFRMQPLRAAMALDPAIVEAGDWEVPEAARGYCAALFAP